MPPEPPAVAKRQELRHPSPHNHTLTYKNEIQRKSSIVSQESHINTKYLRSDGCPSSRFDTSRTNADTAASCSRETARVAPPSLSPPGPTLPQHITCLVLQENKHNYKKHGAVRIASKYINTLRATDIARRRSETSRPNAEIASCRRETAALAPPPLPPPASPAGDFFPLPLPFDFPPPFFFLSAGSCAP